MSPKAEDFPASERFCFYDLESGINLQAKLEGRQGVRNEQIRSIETIPSRSL
jgi:hypothetical protein